MATSPANTIDELSRSKILKRLCSSLNPVVALRKWRNPSQPRRGQRMNLNGRRTLQNSIAALDVAFSVAETIPAFGQPLKGALEALCKVLRLVDQRFQNAEDAAKLTDRLASLIEMLSQFKGMDILLLRLIKQLHSVQRQLSNLLAQQDIRYAAVAQVLTGCNSEIDSCLTEFTALAHAKGLQDSRHQQSEKLAMECVTVLDPFGLPQKMFCVDMGNIQVVALTILNRYNVNPTMKKALNGFVSGGMYELIMDDGHRIKAFTGMLQSPISKGATLVMNVVIVAQADGQQPVCCPVCQENMTTSEDDRTICVTCDRRVSAVKNLEASPTAAQQKESSSSELALFRHITIHELKATDLLEELAFGGIKMPDRSFDSVAPEDTPFHHFFQGAGGFRLG